MPGKIQVMGLGLGGVNLVKSPLELDDNELIQGQNAEIYTTRGVAGIRKRPALKRTNTSALSAVVGAVPVNLPPFGLSTSDSVVGFSLATYVVYSYISSAWKVSYDGGTTWQASPVTPLYTPDTETSSAQPQVNNAVRLNGTTYYLSGGRRIAAFDGQRNYSVVDFGGSGDPRSPAVHNGAVYFLSAIGSADYSLYRIASGVVSNIGVGPVTGSVLKPCSAVSYLGRLWVATAVATGGNTWKVYSIRPGIETSWTTEYTGTNQGGDGGLSMAVYNGELYVSTLDGTNQGLIKKRTVGGTWSTSFTAPDNNSYLTGLTVHGGDLYALYNKSDLTVNKVYRLHSGTWAVDDTPAGRGSGIYAVPNIGLYVASASSIRFRSPGSGTWSQINASGSGEGFFA